MVDFAADEDFQLSPSGVMLDEDFESGSQVIEVEESEAIGEPIEFGDPGVDAFGAEAEAVEVLGIGEEEEAISIDGASAVSAIGGASGGYNAFEIPFTLMQCVSLCMVLAVLSVGGMLVTDLMQNMWSYSETAAPVSSLTDSLTKWLDTKPGS